MLLNKLLIVLSSSLMISCCASFDSRPTPDYVALYGNVAKAMNQKVEPKTPPIVFVQNSKVLSQMFPALSKPGENLLGVYWCGMVYLSQEDLSGHVVAHEFSHYLGADERIAEIVADVCDHQGEIISPGGKQPGAVSNVVEVTEGTRGDRAAGFRSKTP